MQFINSRYIQVNTVQFYFFHKIACINDWRTPSVLTLHFLKPPSHQKYRYNESTTMCNILAMFKKELYNGKALL